MNQPDVLFWIWLSETLGIGNHDFRRLIDLYGSPYDIFRADPDELEQLRMISEKTKQALADKNLEKASSIIDRCNQLGIGIMTYSSDLYPQLLKDIQSPPILLYYAGTVPRLDKRLCIGMVGTRKMSVYGMETAYKISYELAAMQAVVVSGMAAGIDGVSAAAALRAGGTTVAVLGCGLDVVYPRHHGLLMKEISEHGLILSEYPPGTKPVYYHFPVRNRIISGISHGLVVVEAGIGSGSLITAKEAVIQGRDVFAIPANADGIGVEGANGLLRDGAIFATDTEDVIARYRYLFAGTALRSELLHEARKRSAPDTDYLRQMGILEQKPDEAKSAKSKIPVSAPSCRKDRQIQHPIQSVEPTSASGKNSVLKNKSDLKPDCNSGSERHPEKESDPKPENQPRTPDAVLQSLSPVQLAVLQAMPEDRPVTVDTMGNLGYPMGDVIMALTMLEISGLVQKLPGALYKKA